jgi:hypothetical protein
MVGIEYIGNTANCNKTLEISRIFCQITTIERIILQNIATHP